MIINVINTGRGNVYSNMMVQLISEDGDIHHSTTANREKKETVNKEKSE